MHCDRFIQERGSNNLRLFTFNTSWIPSCVGKSKRYAFSPMRSKTVYGPYRSGCNLWWWPLNLFLASKSHTRSPGLKNNGVCCLSCLCLARSWATCKAIATWVWRWDKLWIKGWVDYCSYCWCVVPKGARLRGIYEGARNHWRNVWPYCNYVGWYVDTCPTVCF